MSSAVTMKPLGKDGPLVPRLGLGCMSLSGIYGDPAPDVERLKFLDEAFKMGETFWDTADEYNDNEDLLWKWFAANPSSRSSVFLATKFAIRKPSEHVEGTAGIKVDSSPVYCRQAIEKSLFRLGLSYVDLYYVHRVDKKTPIENTIKAMVELKKEGKIKHIGLSECNADTIRRAHKVHTITAVQVEYSPFCLAIESPEIKVLETCRELGIAIVAYSPLGNGLLTGTLRTEADFTKSGDLRKMLPWMNEDIFAHNIAVVDKIGELANKKEISAAQLSLAWVLAQGDDVFAIPGTTKTHRLKENLGSLAVTLAPEEEKAVREVAQDVKGGRVQDLTGYAFGGTPPLSDA